MHARPSRGRRRNSMIALTGALALSLVVPAATLGTSRHPNPSVAYVELTANAAGGRVVPLINSGQTFDGETFEGIPDGLGVVPVGQGQRYVELYVAFEQSHVPFSGFADFEDSSVQRARLDLKTLQLTKLEEVLPPSAGFIRFCSAFMAGPDEGFDDYTFLLNEESNDVIHVPAGAPYGSDPSVDPYRQGGFSVYLNTKTGAYDEIAGLGRLNHENTVIVPGGWDQTVALTGDDTFNATESQVYMYAADDPDALIQDEGGLLAFRVTATDEGPVDPADPFNDANDYLDIEPGDSWSGEFIPVPGDVARGTTGERPQTALENWSNANNVFQFIRVEDMAYDPDDPRTVYFTDTGTTRLEESDTTGRLFRPSASAVPYINSDGRVFKMVMNEDDPMVVDGFSIVAQGLLAEQLTNPLPPAQPTFRVIDPGVGFRQPDNLDVGSSSLMLQEDSASNNRIWRYDLASSWTHVGNVVNSGTSAESSGIIDMSDWLGAGWWALDVQGHRNLPGVEPPDGQPKLTYEVPLASPPSTLEYQKRREDGQLLLMHIPGT